jgi:hypothetical protein
MRILSAIPAFYEAVSLIGERERLYSGYAQDAERKEKENMPTNTPHQTAKIYQFPVGGRASVLGFRKATSQAVPPKTTHVPSAAIGDGWYHEAAIEEAKRHTEH